MSRKRVTVGDVFEIPLSDGRICYGQFMFWDRNNGPLIQVFDLVTMGKSPPSQILEQVKRAKPMFPPVFTGLFAAVRTGLWEVIGHTPVNQFVYPKFVSVMHERYQPVGIWYIWDGNKWIQIGSELPKQYKNLEFLAGWDPQGIAHRIETGENPYEKMIRNG